MKTLTISLFNRIEYTKTLFDALNKCYGIEDYKIGIFCEPGYEEVHNLARNFRPEQTEVKVNPSRFGCNTNIFQCLAYGFSLSDYHIHLEDDTIPGIDCLKYFEWAKEKYINDSTVFTISGYVNSNNTTEHFYEKNYKFDKVARRKWFTPWGWATWIDRFKEMKPEWDFQGVYGSWDTIINHKVRKDRNEIIPTISRIQNIGGELGTHVPNVEWHKDHHYNEFWIESVKTYSTFFEEINE